jgi:hypothetical protein
MEIKKPAPSSHLGWNSARHSALETPSGTYPALTRIQLGSNKNLLFNKFRFTHAISVAVDTKILMLNFKEVS